MRGLHRLSSPDKLRMCAIWVLATSEVCTGQQAAMAVFTAVTQGILVAGLSNYVNQIIKQTQKSE